MNKMKTWGSASMLVLAAMGTTQAHAAGTTSGTSVLNEVSVGYSVGGTPQTAVTASDTFVVDRKINLTVAEVGGAATDASVSETNAVLTYTVQNTSNAALDFTLAANNVTGGIVAHGQTDTIDASNFRTFVESGVTPGYQAAEDTATFVRNLAADATATVYVLADMPGTGAPGSIAGVVLTASANELGATAAAAGALVTETAAADTKGSVDTVFADADGIGTEGDEDGKHSAGDNYRIRAANVTAVKLSRVVAMPAGIDSSGLYAIPGATVEYCIAVNNATGASPAASLNISDDLPLSVTYVAGSARVNGTITGTYTTASPTFTCNADGVAAGTTFTDNTSPTKDVVAGSVASLPANTTRTLVFRATIN